TLLTGLLLAQLLILAACAGNPAPSPEPASAPALPTVEAAPADAPSPAAAPKTAPLVAQSVSGGGVVVTVKPLTLAPGQPAAFDIAMNSHSVEIVEDMLAATVLRDGAGGQLPAIAWDGPGPGGHHREGVIRFAPLTGDPGEVVLIIRGVANVPEREFRWLPLGSLG
ncbi:MAG: hypothetical protein Q7U96_04795, partial [Chloroflexota bacterium]|nr:hypothetical protein [Chloroflexota bacterium]